MKAHRKLVFNFVIAVSLITLLSLAEVRANESKVHFSNFENESRSSLQLGWSLKSRRLLQDRQAPRGFPPPDGNALVHNPRERTPPSKRPRVPDDPPPLKMPPPHP